MLKARIFFLHNPKAGGTSLRAALASLAHSDSAAPVFCNAPNDYRVSRTTLDRYRGFDFYAGHYGYDVYRRLRAGHLLVTNFREPVDRIFSLYRFWRNNITLESLSHVDARDVDVVELSHKLSFSNFIRSKNDDLRLYINNFHFRQILNSGWEWNATDWRSNWIVKHRIQRMAWFYIAETPEASAALLQRCFSHANAFEIPRVNQSGGNLEAIDPEDVEYLKRLNALDSEIYGFALRLQEERLMNTLD